MLCWCQVCLQQQAQLNSLAQGHFDMCRHRASNLQPSGWEMTALLLPPGQSLYFDQVCYRQKELSSSTELRQPSAAPTLSLSLSLSHTHAVCASLQGAALAIEGNLEFSVLIKDTSTYGQQAPWFESPTFRLGGNHSTTLIDTSDRFMGTIVFRTIWHEREAPRCNDSLQTKLRREMHCEKTHLHINSKYILEYAPSCNKNFSLKL